MYFCYCKKCNKRYASAAPLEYIISAKCECCGEPLTEEKFVKQPKVGNSASGSKLRRSLDNGDFECVILVESERVSVKIA